MAQKYKYLSDNKFKMQKKNEKVWVSFLLYHIFSIPPHFLIIYRQTMLIFTWKPNEQQEQNNDLNRMSKPNVY